MGFAELIASTRSDLACFDGKQYPICFKRFETECAPLFASLDETALADAAAALIDKLEAEWTALPRRQEKLTAEQDMQVLAFFLSPAALRHGETTAAFSALLQEQWNRRYPKNSYRRGRYETILDGFAVSILGIPLRRRKREEELL